MTKKYELYFCINPGGRLEEHEELHERAKEVSAVFNRATETIGGINYLVSGIGGTIDEDGDYSSEPAMCFSIITSEPDSEEKVVRIASEIKEACGLESVAIVTHVVTLTAI